MTRNCANVAKFTPCGCPAPAAAVFRPPYARTFERLLDGNHAGRVRTHMPHLAWSAKPVSDVLTIRQDVGEADEGFASGYFSAVAEGANHPGPGPPGDLVEMQAFESCFGGDDVREWRTEDLDDLGSAALMSPDPAVVADTELLPAAAGYQVQQIWVVAAGQVRM